MDFSALTHVGEGTSKMTDEAQLFLDTVLSAVADAGFEPVAWCVHDNQTNIHRNRQTYPTTMRNDTIKIVVDARTRDGSQVRIEHTPWRRAETDHHYFGTEPTRPGSRTASATLLSPSLGEGETVAELDEFDRLIVTTAVEALRAAGLDATNWAIGSVGEREELRFGEGWSDATHGEHRRILMTVAPSTFERAPGDRPRQIGLPGAHSAPHVEDPDRPMVPYPDAPPRPGKGPYRIRRTDPVPEGQKRCTSCEIDFPADTTEFDRNASKADGLDSWCKTCVGQRSKRYRQLTKSRQSLADSIPADPDWRRVLFATRELAETAYPAFTDYATVTAGLHDAPLVEENNGMYAIKVQRAAPLAWMRSVAQQFDGIVVEN